MHNDKVQGGIPGMELMERVKIPFGEDTGHLDLSLVGPLSGADIAESIARCARALRRARSSAIGRRS